MAPISFSASVMLLVLHARLQLFRGVFTCQGFDVSTVVKTQVGLFKTQKSELCTWFGSLEKKQKANEGSKSLQGYCGNSYLMLSTLGGTLE